MEEELKEAQDKIKELEKQLKTKEKCIELKVSEKRCVQINGIRKYPFTFYKKEIEKILEMGEEIKNFMETNKDSIR